MFVEFRQFYLKYFFNSLRRITTKQSSKGHNCWPFVRGIHRYIHKGPVTRKVSHIIMSIYHARSCIMVCFLWVIKPFHNVFTGCIFLHSYHWGICVVTLHLCQWSDAEKYTVYHKKYAHGFCFAVLCCGYTLTDFPISIRLTSLALWQSNDCPSASKATLMNMDKYFMWIHHERLHNHNKAKHNKTVCIFLGIYCI